MRVWQQSNLVEALPQTTFSQWHTLSSPISVLPGGSDQSWTCKQKELCLGCGRWGCKNRKRKWWHDLRLGPILSWGSDRGWMPLRKSELQYGPEGGDGIDMGIKSRGSSCWNQEACQIFSRQGKSDILSKESSQLLVEKQPGNVSKSAQNVRLGECWYAALAILHTICEILGNVTFTMLAIWRLGPPEKKWIWLKIEFLKNSSSLNFRIDGSSGRSSHSWNTLRMIFGRRRKKQHTPIVCRGVGVLCLGGDFQHHNQTTYENLWALIFFRSTIETFIAGEIICSGDEEKVHLQKGTHPWSGFL